MIVSTDLWEKKVLLTEVMHCSPGAQGRWEDSRRYHQKFKVVETDRPPATLEEFEKLLKEKIGQTTKSSTNEVYKRAAAFWLATNVICSVLVLMRFFLFFVQLRETILKIGANPSPELFQAMVYQHYNILLSNNLLAKIRDKHFGSSSGTINTYKYLRKNIFCDFAAFSVIPFDHDKCGLTIERMRRRIALTDDIAS